MKWCAIAPRVSFLAWPAFPPKLQALTVVPADAAADIIDLSEPQTVAGLVIHVHHQAPTPVANSAGIVIDVTPNAEVGSSKVGSP